MKLVITGGGTGGHIYAGVAIAQEFTSQGKGNEVLFVGSTYGLETTLVPKAGFNLETLSLGRLVKQNLFTTLKTLFQIPIAILKSMYILKKFKADSVIGVGGFAAGPCIVAAKILGIPCGVLEQNSVMGFTNRIAAKLSKHVFLAFDQIPKGISKNKCIVTGNPTRIGLVPTPLKTQKPFVIFAFGGSQGALAINNMLIKSINKLLELKSDLQIIHQTGQKDFERVKKIYDELKFPANVQPFIHDMQAAYNKASVVICRAGSSSISELGATKNAAIFVPYPFAAGNHQEKNARAVERAGGAKVILESEENSHQILAKLLEDLMKNPQQLENMRNNMGQFYRADAAQKILDILKIHMLKQ